MRSKLLSVFLTILVAMVVLSFLLLNPVFSDNNGDSEVASLAESYRYSETETGISIVSYIGTEADVVIPERFNEKPVVRLAEGCFSGCSILTSVAVPNTVEVIEERAFRMCENLTSVVLPESLVQLSPYAFSQCGSLRELVIPDGVTAVEEGLLSGCTSLVRVTLPSSATAINKFAFTNCTSLQTVTLPESVIFIGESAFNGCSSLQAVPLPEGIERIGTRAFLNCSSLKSLTISNASAEIQDYAIGYTYNEEKQRVTIDGFTLYGLEASTAMDYCSQNDLKLNFELISSTAMG